MACVCFGVLIWDDPNKPQQSSQSPPQHEMPGPATDQNTQITTQATHPNYAGAVGRGHEEKKQHHDEKKNAYNPVSAVTAVVSAVAGGNAGSIEEVLFFPDGQMPCKWWGTQKGCNRQNCQFAHANTSLMKFLKYLDSAQQTMDICVFTITCNEIAEAIMDAHKRGVKVRVLSDNAQTQTTGSDVDEIQNSGIPTKHAIQQGNNLMHHKFCVIDHKLLLSGSFNWTRQAVLGNQENVLITNNQTYVNKFATQFEKLWATGGL